MFDTVLSLRPYFHSLREIAKNVSLDIKIPATWTYDMLQKYSPSMEVKEQDRNDQFLLISLISLATKDGYNLVISSAKELIKSNMEEQEKLELFQKMVGQLQTIFKSETLDKIKELDFLPKNEPTDPTGIRMAGEAESEGPASDQPA